MTVDVVINTRRGIAGVELLTCRGECKSLGRWRHVNAETAHVLGDMREGDSQLQMRMIEIGLLVAELGRKRHEAL